MPTVSCLEVPCRANIFGYLEASLTSLPSLPPRRGLASWQTETASCLPSFLPSVACLGRRISNAALRVQPEAGGTRSVEAQGVFKVVSVQTVTTKHGSDLGGPKRRWCPVGRSQG